MAEKTVTEREAVLRERDAFARGVNWYYCQKEVPSNANLSLDRISDAADAIHRLPKITRPRTREDDYGVEWQVVGDVLRWRYTFAKHRTFNTIIPGAGTDGMFMYLSRAVLIAELAANPTEEVEDTGDE